LRQSPETLDQYDEVSSHHADHAVFGNILSKFVPGATATIAGRQKDKLGNEWLFVIVDRDSNALAYHRPFRVNAGWTKTEKAK
jgi:hypothetical protein